MLTALSTLAYNLCSLANACWISLGFVNDFARITSALHSCFVLTQMVYFSVFFNFYSMHGLLPLIEIWWEDVNLISG